VAGEPLRERERERASVRARARTRPRARVRVSLASAAKRCKPVIERERERERESEEGERDNAKKSSCAHACKTAEVGRAFYEAQSHGDSEPFYPRRKMCARGPCLLSIR
jgi:hypothetical protein